MISQYIAGVGCILLTAIAPLWVCVLSFTLIYLVLAA